jgi:flavin reductase (DIM6/NTAB) family NADH-FMN oxidoreductase RutF
MTANAFTSVSLEPPLVLVSVGKQATTCRHISASGAFAVNILSSEQEEIARRFAGRHREMVDPFWDLPYRPGQSGSPILADVVAWVDCSLYATYDGGDHTLFLGQVVEIGLDPTRGPILFYGGTFRELGSIGVDEPSAPAGVPAVQRKAG